MRFFLSTLSFASIAAAGDSRAALTHGTPAILPRQATTAPSSPSISSPPLTVGWLAIGSLDGNTACKLATNYSEGAGLTMIRGELNDSRKRSLPLDAGQPLAGVPIFSDLL